MCSLRLLIQNVGLRLWKDVVVLRYVLKQDLILVRYARRYVLHFTDDHLFTVAHKLNRRFVSLQPVRPLVCFRLTWKRHLLVLVLYHGRLLSPRW